MKHFLLITMLACMSLSLNAQTFDQFVERFSKAENAEVVKLDKNTLGMMMSMSSEAQDSEDSEKMKKMKDVISKLRFVNIISLEESSESDRKAFCEAVENLTVEGLELLMDTKEDAEHVKIFANIKEDRCRELVVLSASMDDPVMVHVAGDFDMNELKQQGGGLLGGIEIP